MKKLLFIILPLLSLCYSCKKEKVYALDHREAPYLYYDKQEGGYVTFESYMWVEGFPDSIIVEFTVNGEFQGYTKAGRRGILEDSLGNAYSPAYVIMAYNGDNWVYDIKGKFIEFNQDWRNDPKRDPYVPYNP